MKFLDNHIIGLVGVLMVPFFSNMDGGGNDTEDSGMFWHEDCTRVWKWFGINLVGSLSIIVWSILWSFVMFGTLNFFNLLRIDPDTESRGNDLMVHGEAAYPEDPLVESDYENTARKKSPILAPIMQGNGARENNKKTNNDSFEMVQTTVEMS